MRGEPVGLAVEGEQRALDLLVVLELDLEQPDQLDGDAGRAGDARRSEYSSAGNTFSISRCAMRLPIVARRSPAITTPPSKVTATIVVPCGTSGTAPAGSARPAGQQRGGRAPRGTR